MQQKVKTLKDGVTPRDGEAQDARPGVVASLISITPQIASVFAQLLAAERSRAGLTDEEIFERAGVKLDENERKLVADFARLSEPEQKTPQESGQQ